MSESWIYLIPDDPHFVPEPTRQELARRRFIEAVPEAEQVELSINEKVQFRDCGDNFERILCPSCRAEISISWWHECMDEDFSDQGFKVAGYATPCCGSITTMHDLAYEWPQGLYRFSLGVRGGNFGVLGDGEKRKFEEILGCKLRVIYQHL
jgi:hypothetical protein